MAVGLPTEERDALKSLVDELIGDPFGFSFYQALYLLETHFENSARIGTFDRTRHNLPEQIRLGNVSSLCFPANQIGEISPTDGLSDTYTVRTSLMGLYGVFSPLPTVYSMSAIGEDDVDSDTLVRLRDFMDIFNHRILSLAYRVDKRRLVNRMSTAERLIIGDNLLSLAGWAPELVPLSSEDNPGEDIQLDALFLLSGGTRPARGLTMWLTWHQPGMRFAVEEFCPQWSEIPASELCALGGDHCRLAAADNSYGAPIGTRMLDRETKFRLEIGPVFWDDFMELLPDRRLWNRITQLTQDYCPDWLTYDIRLLLNRSDCANLAVCLDGQNSQLGLNTGLYADEEAANHLNLLFDIEPPSWQGDDAASMGVIV